MEIKVKPRVVIIGAGFGGLWAARSLAHAPVDVLLIDKNDYHTFLALLYQVAAAELEAEDIAYPVRSILWKFPNIDFLLAHTHRIDLTNREIETDGGTITYNYLILATGSISHSFGIPGVEDYAYGLKSLEEAVTLKNHIICCFEAAAHEADETRRRSLLTFVIVGGGATGVEYAGALSELIHGSLTQDYRSVDFSTVRIILLEALDRLVANMPERVRRYTLRRLQKMGVQVRLGAKVQEVLPEAVLLSGPETIATRTLVWTAGVRGEPTAAISEMPTQRDGRVPVLPTLQVPGWPEVYVVGDTAAIRETDHTLPMVAQVAIQSAIAAASNIHRQVTGEAPQPFHYRDRGAMITIGRNAAGAAIGSRTYTGFFAWLLWLVIHLFNLIGFRNRVMVLINWAWDYLLYERAVRFVFPRGLPPLPRCLPAAPERVPEKTSLVLMVRGIDGWQCKIKGGALIYPPLGPDPPAELIDETLDNRQADPRALELLLVMETLKNPEQPLGKPFIEPDAVIPDMVDNFLSPFLPRYFDDRHIPRFGKFDRVVKEIAAYLSDCRLISQGRRHFSHFHLYLLSRLLPHDFLDQGTEQTAHVQFLQDDFLPAGTGKGEDIVDKTTHLLGIVPHNTQQPAIFRIQPVAVHFLEAAGKAVNCPQRGLQVMGNGIAEAFQVLIHCFQFSRPLGNTLFQVCVQPPDFLLRLFAFFDFCYQRPRSFFHPLFQAFIHGFQFFLQLLQFMIFHDRHFIGGKEQFKDLLPLGGNEKFLPPEKYLHSLLPLCILAQFRMVQNTLYP